MVCDSASCKPVMFDVLWSRDECTNLLEFLVSCMFGNCLMFYITHICNSCPLGFLELCNTFVDFKFGVRLCSLWCVRFAELVC